LIGHFNFSRHPHYVFAGAGHTELKLIIAIVTGRAAIEQGQRKAEDHPKVKAFHSHDLYSDTHN
jgi:hypothetical protein